MKKWMVLFLSAAMILSLCACGSSKNEPAPSGDAPAQAESAAPEAAQPEPAAAQDASEPAEAPATEEASEPAEAPATEEASEPAEVPATEEASEPAEASAALGGWTMNSDETTAALPEEVQNAFDQAAEKLLGNNLTPVALLGSQVVNGTNYAILCRSELVTAEPVVSYQVVILYADLQGNAEFTNIADFNLTDYTEGDGAELSAETLMGGWQVPEEYAVVNLPADVQGAFDKAMEGFVGSNQEPLAYLASQVVSGTNYAILCRSTLVTAQPVSGISVVTIYQDLQGEAKITNIHVIDPAEFNQ